MAPPIHPAEPLDDWSVASLLERFHDLSRGLPRRAPRAGTLQEFPVVPGQATPNATSLRVVFGPSFVRAVRKARLGRSRLLGKTLANLRYGYDPSQASSRGGRDGIFHVDEDFEPRNAMITKLYDRFRASDEGRTELELAFSEAWQSARGVRVVSHGLRLLGFVGCPPSPEAEPRVWKLLLVDLDVNRPG